MKNPVAKSAPEVSPTLNNVLAALPTAVWLPATKAETRSFIRPNNKPCRANSKKVLEKILLLRAAR